jgi:hypothetical protein
MSILILCQVAMPNVGRHIHIPILFEVSSTTSGLVEVIFPAGLMLQVEMPSAQLGENL